MEIKWFARAQDCHHIAVLSLQATSLYTSKASNVFSICKATTGEGVGGGFHYYYNMVVIICKPQEQPFFFWLNWAFWLKEISKWLKHVFFWFSSRHIFYSFFRSFAKFPCGSLACSKFFEGILNFFLLSNPFYGQIWLNCIMASQFSYITNMKTKRTITAQVSIPFPCSKTSLP